MSSITYTALRGIQAGHSLGLEYDLDFSAQAISTSQKTSDDVSVSISGKKQVAVYYRQKSFSIVSDILETGTQAFDDFYEFMESVDEMETFTFDELGTTASPSNPITVRLTGNYKKQRISNQEKYRFSFSCEEVL
jgi:hypothetical protein